MDNTMIKAPYRIEQFVESTHVSNFFENIQAFYKILETKKEEIKNVISKKGEGKPIIFDLLSDPTLINYFLKDNFGTQKKWFDFYQVNFIQAYLYNNREILGFGKSDLKSIAQLSIGFSDSKSIYLFVDTQKNLNIENIFLPGTSERYEFFYLPFVWLSENPLTTFRYFCSKGFKMVDEDERVPAVLRKLSRNGILFESTMYV